VPNGALCVAYFFAVNRTRARRRPCAFTVQCGTAPAPSATLARMLPTEAICYVIIAATSTHHAVLLAGLIDVER